MPDYKIRDPSTGRVLTVRGDSPPTEAEMEDLFASAPAPKPAAAAAAAPEQDKYSQIAEGMGNSPVGWAMRTGIKIAKDPTYATGALPILGGLIGGTVGTAGGPAGTIGGSALGAAGGEAWRQNLNRWMGYEAPGTMTQAAKDIGVEGAAGAVTAGAFEGTRAAAATPAGRAVLGAAKQAVKEIPGVGKLGRIVQAGRDAWMSPAEKAAAAAKEAAQKAAAQAAARQAASAERVATRAATAKAAAQQAAEEKAAATGLREVDPGASRNYVDFEPTDAVRNAPPLKFKTGGDDTAPLVSHEPYSIPKYEPPNPNAGGRLAENSDDPIAEIRSAIEEAQGAPVQSPPQSWELPPGRGELPPDYTPRGSVEESTPLLRRLMSRGRPVRATKPPPEPPSPPAEYTGTSMEPTDISSPGGFSTPRTPPPEPPPPPTHTGTGMEPTNIPRPGGFSTPPSAARTTPAAAGAETPPATRAAEAAATEAPPVTPDVTPDVTPPPESGGMPSAWQALIDNPPAGAPAPAAAPPTAPTGAPGLITKRTMTPRHVQNARDVHGSEEAAGVMSRLSGTKVTPADVKRMAPQGSVAPVKARMRQMDDRYKNLIDPNNKSSALLAPLAAAAALYERLMRGGRNAPPE